MASRLRMTDRREQLVGTALDLAARDGLGTVTVREVARAAGVSTGVVHYCFADKDDLLAAMAEQIVRDLAASAAGAATVPGPPGATLDDVLRTGVRALWRGLERAPQHQLLTYEITVTGLRTPSLHGAALRQYTVSASAVTAFLEAAAAVAGVDWSRPLEDVAALVLAQVDGVTLRWLVDGDARAARRRLDAFAGLVAGLAVPAARPEPAEPVARSEPAELEPAS